MGRLIVRVERLERSLPERRNRDFAEQWRQIGLIYPDDVPDDLTQDPFDLDYWKAALDDVYGPEEPGDIRERTTR